MPSSAASQEGGVSVVLLGGRITLPLSKKKKPKSRSGPPGREAAAKQGAPTEEDGVLLFSMWCVLERHAAAHVAAPVAARALSLTPPPPPPPPPPVRRVCAAGPGDHVRQSAPCPTFSCAMLSVAMAVGWAC